MAVKDWSTTPGSNTTIDGTNIAEACAPSGINDAIRKVMASVVEGDFGSGTVHFDNITESTADAGVTIEAVTLKDGAITVAGVVGAATTSFVLIPAGTTAQRGSPSDCALRRNSSDSRLEYYDGSAWNQLQGYDADTAKLDADQSWTGAQRGSVTTDNDGSFDMAAGNNFNWTPTGADTLEFTNETAGQSGLIYLSNGSGHAITMGSEILADSSAASTLSAAGNYLIGYYSPDGTNVAISYSQALT